jgi:small subunit ribosomal protein S5
VVDYSEQEAEEHIEKIITLNRVSKVVKGGRRFSFSAIVVVGDGKGNVGVALGKANEVPEAIRKGSERARKTMFPVPLSGTTIPHEVVGKFGAGLVLLKPASEGTGVIAGSAVRAILEAAGVKDVLTKSIRTSNPHNVVHATVTALKSLRSPEEVKAKRGLDTLPGVQAEQVEP